MYCGYMLDWDDIVKELLVFHYTFATVSPLSINKIYYNLPDGTQQRKIELI
jgi:hypothetical protein